MTIPILLFIFLSSLWCSGVCLYADSRRRARSPHTVRRVTAALCWLTPIAAGLALGLDAALLAAAAILAIVLIFWFRLTAVDHEDWETEYAYAPKARLDGRVMRVSNIRNFRYRSVAEPIPAYYDAAFDIDTVTGVDLVCSYWSSTAIAHVFVSFGFADGRHLAVSVETRRRRGQEYSTIAGFFRHYQLIFVVADERDLIGVRTDTRREQVYLYRLRTTAEERRRLFCGYMGRAEALAERPEFYDTATNNCTTNIVRIINGGLPRGQRLKRDWRLLISGYADQCAYDIGRLKTRLPFADYKARSLIVRPANAVLDDDFSRVIRQTLP